MKRILAILFASLILASGMHLSFATHYCGGKEAASKISFSELKASCGMESGITECPSHSKKQIDNDCCKDVVSVYSIEKNYNPATFEFKQFSLNVLHIFLVPNTIGNLATSSSLLNTNASPPDNLKASEVRLASICVFRIWYLSFYWILANSFFNEIAKRISIQYIFFFNN